MTPLHESLDCNQSSSTWLFDDLLSREDTCMLRLIWDQSGAMSHLPTSLMYRLSILTDIFRGLTPYERFASGSKLIAYAGIDCALAQCPSLFATYEVMQEIKGGMHDYAMAMGCDRIYEKHVTVYNMYSSLKYFFTLPTREYYTTDEEHVDDVTRMVAEKAACLRRVWSLATTHSAPHWSNVQFEQDTCRDILYKHLSRNTDARLIAVLREVIIPRGIDALRLTWATDAGVDDAWLKSCTWRPILSVCEEYINTVTMDLCKDGRTDVLRWMLDNPSDEDHTNNILTALSATSVDLVSDLVDLYNIDTEAVEHLYLGAFSNPDDTCLFHLAERGLKPPETFRVIREISAVALACKRSHSAFLVYMTSTMGFSIDPSQIKDFLLYLDTDCMSVFLNACGDELATYLNAHSWIPRTFVYSSMCSPRALDNVLRFLIECLTATHPSKELLLSILTMCSNFFVGMARHVEDTGRVECFSKLRSIMRHYDEVKSRLTVGHRTFPHT